MEKLYDLLKTLGLPVVYHHFKTPPKLPYIVYFYTNSDNFGADNKVYHNSDNYQIELYTEKKEQNTEKLIEDLFKSNDIYYEKTETYIDDEKLYQVIYEI